MKKIIKQRDQMEFDFTGLILRETPKKNPSRRAVAPGNAALNKPGAYDQPNSPASLSFEKAEPMAHPPQKPDISASGRDKQAGNTGSRPCFKETGRSLKPAKPNLTNYRLPEFPTELSLIKKARGYGKPRKSPAPLFDNRIHKLLSTREASGILGVSENALRILVCRKKIKAYKMGCRLKFKTDDLMACLQSKEV